MIRTTVPTSVRKGSALVGIAGLLVLAGCATTPTDTGGTTDSTSGTDSATGSESSSGADASSSYADGTYTAEGSYQTPESVETISVTVTLADDVITAVEVTGDPQKRESEQYQGQFIGGIADVVVGQDIDDIQVSRVAGSSLTSNGFNEAIEAIKSEAAS